MDEIAVHYSSWNAFPTEADPEALYKFAGVDFSLSLDMRMYSRQTYSLLDFLGDIGGVLEFFIYLGEFLANPFALYTLQ